MCSVADQLPVAFYYFDFRDTHKQTCYGLIASLVRDLSRYSAVASSLVLDLYNIRHAGEHAPSIEELSSCLKDILESLQPRSSSILIDALDECTERDTLLSFLERLHSWQIASVRVILTSRREVTISRRLEALNPSIRRLGFECCSVEDDIISYVRSVMEDPNSGLGRWGTEDRRDIERSLCNGAQGM